MCGGLNRSTQQGRRGRPRDRSRRDGQRLRHPSGLWANLTLLWGTGVPSGSRSTCLAAGLLFVMWGARSGRQIVREAVPANEEESDRRPDRVAAGLARRGRCRWAIRRRARGLLASCGRDLAGRPPERRPRRLLGLARRGEAGRATATTTSTPATTSGWRPSSTTSTTESTKSTDPGPGDDEPYLLPIAPDGYHKDNISGGAPYGMALRGAWLAPLENFSWTGRRPRSGTKGPCDLLSYLRSSLLFSVRDPWPVRAAPRSSQVRAELLRDVPLF